MPVGAPFYRDRLVTLYCADSIQHAHLWTSAAVLVTDPPYGLEALAGAYGTTHRTILNDSDTRVRDEALALWGPDKPAAVFGSPRLEDPPGGWSDRLVWDKGQLGLNGGPWRYAHESIFVRGDGWERPSASSSSILRHTSQSNRANVNNHIHSKPVRLMVELLSAAPAGLIADPFAGGGATVEAAVLLGRPIVAFELDPEHCETIARRVSQIMDVTLFDTGDAQ